MKTITVTAYSFDELSDKAKDKARQWMREGIDWWQYATEQDAKEAKLELVEWELERYCHIAFTGTPIETAKLILVNHGAMCDTYKAASLYKSMLANIGAGDYLAGDAAVEQFRVNLERAYLSLLNEDFNYHMYGEGLDEHIQANDYLFTEDGSRTTVL